MKLFDGLHAFLWTSMGVNNCNTYVIDDVARILIDPGHLRLLEHVEKGLEQMGIGLESLDLVIATHAHPDHVEGVRRFKDAGVLFAMHQTDWILMKDMARSLGVSMDMEQYQPDFFLTEGELNIKKLSLEVLHCPGHSPGSISIYWPERKALFPGDVLFRDGLGRTDLPGGDSGALKESIRRLSMLDVEWVLPGHGGVISGRKEIQANFSQVEQFWFAYI